MSLKKDLKPEIVHKYIDVLDGRPGLVGVWIMHGAPCLRGHPDCIGYMCLVTPESFSSTAAELASIYATCPEIRNSGMCWTFASTQALDVSKFPLNWERVLVATSAVEAKSAGITPHQQHCCQNCGLETNGSTSLAEEPVAPEPGHISLCAGCGFACRFNENLQLIAMTTLEIDQLPTDVRTELLRLQQRIKATNGDWRRRPS
jgi:hypothetical protein